MEKLTSHCGNHYREMVNTGAKKIKQEWEWEGRMEERIKEE